MIARLGPVPAVMVPLSFFVVAVVVVEAALSPLGFGTTGGAPLLLLSSTLVYSLAAAAFFAAPPDSTGRLAAVGGMAAAALGMHVADPTGPVIGLFLVAALTPLAGHVVVGTVLLAVSIVSYNGVQLGLGSETIPITIATDAGCLFFYLFGRLVRTERAQREAVSRLLHELEASRLAEREASRLAERATLAREIHDVLAHSMSGLVIQLSGAQLLAQATQADPGLVDAIDRATRLARSGLDEARRSVRMLREETLPGLDAIGRLLRDHAEATGIEVDWTETGEKQPVSADIELTAYRWAQETLSNVRKHAARSVAHLHVDWSTDHVTLEAWNKLGADAPSMGPGSGYGLQGMAERAHNVGGTLEVKHSAQAFRTVMRLPLTAIGTDSEVKPAP